MKEIQPQQIWNEEKIEGVKKLIQKQKLIDMMEQDEQLGLYEETKCYCGHTTTCDCGPEETKQETLEEVEEKNFINIGGVLVLEDGAKWQQERSYSEEEVLDITKQAYAMGRSNYTIEAFNNWFKQFKKK